MKIHLPSINKATRAVALGFTLVETVIAILLASIMLLALYSSFSGGYTAIRVTCEDLRATQILLTRLERVRLCTYAEVSHTQTNPPTLLEYYSPKDLSTSRRGVTYTVTYNTTLATNSLPSAYNKDVLLVTVTALWTNISNVPHTRSMQTYVAKSGINGYVSTRGN